MCGLKGKALDNIDLSEVSHRFLSGILQNDRYDPWTSAHLIDRSEDVIYGQYYRF